MIKALEITFSGSTPHNLGLYIMPVMESSP